MSDIKEGMTMTKDEAIRLADEAKRLQAQARHITWRLADAVGAKDDYCRKLEKQIDHLQQRLSEKLAVELDRPNPGDAEEITRLRADREKFVAEAVEQDNKIGTLERGVERLRAELQTAKDELAKRPTITPEKICEAVRLIHVLPHPLKQDDAMRITSENLAQALINHLCPPAAVATEERDIAYELSIERNNPAAAEPNQVAKDIHEGLTELAALVPGADTPSPSAEPVNDLSGDDRDEEAANRGGYCLNPPSMPAKAADPVKADKYAGCWQYKAEEPEEDDGVAAYVAVGHNF